MNPSAPFIQRPVATSLLMIAILLVGMVGYLYLPLSALPEVDYPTIQVQTFLPGASPDVMTTTVTAPLERQFGQMPGLKQMSSVSSAGASVVTLQFDLSLSLDIAEQQVQASINAAGNLLPQSLPAPPIYAKVNPADAPILTLAISSKSMPLTQVEDLADTRIAQKISQLPGVGLVSIAGGQRPAIRVRANLQALAAYGLNIDDLRTTISNANSNAPKGNFDGASRSYTINANDQLQSIDDYRNIVVAYKNGAPVHLSDVADVSNSAENNKLSSWMNTTPAILLNVQRQPGANVISVVDGIKQILPQIEAGLPGSIDVKVLTDRTNTIRASVADVEFELGLAVVLVVLVIYLFLRNLPATFIPSLSVPLSIVGTFAAMYLLGYSLNNLSLMALTIASGFVVDDAIVMIENISRYIEQGEKPYDAAMRGAGEIGFTIVSLTVSLIAVLIPLLFMQEVVGRLFREFAVTLAITILISAAVSLTLVPMLCAKLLRHRTEQKKQGKIARKAEEYFDRVIKEYDRLLSLGARSSAVHAFDRGYHAGRDGAALYRHSEGLFPGAGHRPRAGHYPGRSYRFLQRHGRAAERARARASEGQRRPEPFVLHRRRRHQQHAQQRPVPDQLEAQGRSLKRYFDRAAPPVALGTQRRGDLGLFPAGTGFDDRFHRQPRAVSVRARGFEHGNAEPICAASDRCPFEAA